MAGCATQPAHEAAPAPAQLVVNNLTDYRWHIAIRTVSGTLAGDLQLAPRSSQSVSLEGADYVIEQSAQADGPFPGLARSISVHFDAGQAYAWPLVTLLSETGAGASRQ